MGQGTRTLIYAPGVEAYIATRDNQMLVLSNDIIRGQVRRAENGVSQATLILNNKRAQYSRTIDTMDRLVIFMKRLNWVQVFAGYVDEAPFLDLYPTTATVNASCTLKRLLHTWWDPGLVGSSDILDQTKYLNGPTDTGLGDMLINLLTRVGGWHPDAIKVQQIPQGFLDFAKKTAGNLDPNAYDTAITTLKKALGITGNQSSNSSTPYSGNANLPPGVYGGVSLNAEQLGNAGAIATVGATKGASPRDVTCALMTAMQESTLRNLNYGDRDSLGLFQQRPSQGWGTQAQIMDPAYSAGKFYDALFGLGNSRNGMDLGAECQAVQRSAFPSAYSKWQPMASDLVSKNIGSTPPVQGPVLPGRTLSPTPGPSGTNPAPTIPAYGPNATTAQLMDIFGHSAAEVQANLVTVNFQGHQVQVHKLVAGVFQRVDQQITDAHTGYNFRSVGTWAWRGMGVSPVPINGVVSWHGFGIAMDINPDTNPYSAGTGPLPHDIPQTVVDIFKSNGFGWGGDWTSPKDYMHFQYQGGGNASDAAFGGDQTQSSPGSTGLFNAMFQTAQFVDVASGFLRGKKALINDQQLITTVQSVARAGLRSFCSSPDGQFMAYYPDHFGLAGKPPSMTLEDIECVDVKIKKNDSSLATHVYTVGNDNGVNLLTSNPLAAWMGSTGVVTVEDDNLFNMILGIDPKVHTEYSFQEIYARYGARPLTAQFPMIRSPLLEYFQALQVFMEKWAGQFSTQVSFTFMPELFPGMRTALAGHNLAVYVSQVVHTFDMEGGFTTDAVITAPSTTPGGIPGLPISGGGR